MDSRTLIRGSLVAGLIAALGGVGCSLAASEETGSAPDEVVANADTSQLLKSTLVLEGGCTASKVGPKHLLVSARCVTDNSAFAAGKVLSFASAASGEIPTPRTAAAAAPANDAGPAKDSGAADASHDSGTNAAPAASSRDVTIASIEIHPSYVAKCKATAANADVCGFNTLEASDSPDIALIILSSELESVPSIPIDLDPVGQADSLLVVTAGCSSVEGKAVSAPKTVRTIAVPAKSVNHAGSPYEKSPQLVTRLASSYVVTAGAGWHATDPRFCPTDIGAPLFRAGAVAVAGVTANYTTFADAKLPVTTHHTRVDAMSRFKIGDWLSGLGALTVHSCSEASGGCAKHTYDGGTPSGPTGEGPTGTTEPGDAGKPDVIAPDASPSDDAGTTAPPDDTGPHQDQLPGEDPSVGTPSGDEPDYADAAVPKKKKSAAKGGCSAAPGGPAPTGELFLGIGLALGAVIIRRRRAR